MGDAPENRTSLGLIATTGDIGGKRTAICVIDGSGKTVWRGTVDTHPEMIDGALQRR